MEKLRKVFVWALLAAMVFTSAVSAQATELKGEITFMVLDAMTKTEDAPIYQAVARFEEENPGCKVIVEPVPASDLKAKYTNTALAGAAPDVVSLDTGGWIVDGAAIGILEPLDERLAPIMDQFQPGALDAGLYEGQYYAVPWYMNNAGMFYNKTILEESGVEKVPTTWEEFNEAAKAITEKGYKVLTISSEPAYFMFMFFMQNGNFVLDTSVTPPVSIINNEDGKAAFTQFLNIHLEYDGFPEGAKDAIGWDQIVAPFIQGDTAFLLIGDWGNSMVSGGNPDLQYGIAPLPVGKQAATVMGGFSLCMSKNSQNPELAWAFIEYLTALEQNDVMLGYGRIGARRDIDQAALIEMTPHLETFINQAKDSYARPGVKAITEVETIMNYAFQSVYLGVSTIDEALAECDEKLNALMAEKYQ